MTMTQFVGKWVRLSELNSKLASAWTGSGGLTTEEYSERLRLLDTVTIELKNLSKDVGDKYEM